MGVSNGIVTTPINPQEVYILRGVAKYNGWWDNEYISANMHKKTNKWSKKKPIQYNSVGEISFNTDLTRTAGLVWGMKPPKMKTGQIYFNTMCFDILSGNSSYPNWEYNPPVPGRDWCRLTDFNGYNHNAGEVFTTGITNYKNVINLFDQEKINFFFMLNQEADFTIEEFMGAFVDYHFVVELYVEEGTPFYAMKAPSYKFISEKAIKDMSGWYENIQIDMNDDLGGGAKLENKTVAVCMGLQNIQSGNPEPGTGIVAPWSSTSTPFYKSLEFVSHFERDLQVNEYALTAYNPTWYSASTYNPLTFNGTRPLYVKCSIEQKERGLYIIPYGSSYNPPNSKKILIRGRVDGDYTNTQHAKTLSSSLQNVQYIYVEPTTEENKAQDIYFGFENILKIGTARHLILEASADNGSTWSTIEVVPINVTCV